jgi:hypothetical protein
MPRVPADLVDEAWTRIARATQEGRLGIAAKVSTALNNAESPHSEGRAIHVICVYTADCRDVEDVMRALLGLRALGFTQRLSYKEDGATFAGIYGPGSALYVSQPNSADVERRREPVATPDEHLNDADIGR